VKKEEAWAVWKVGASWFRQKRQKNSSGEEKSADNKVTRASMARIRGFLKHSAIGAIKRRKWAPKRKNIW